MNDSTSHDLINLTADIVSAHISNNSVSTDDLPRLIADVHAALVTSSSRVEPEAAAPVPAVSVRTSIRNDHIVCLEDGKKLKMLKRYLRTNYSMTPEEYRNKWGLPRDYPMVAPAYAEQRRSLAKSIGLGRKKGVVEAVAAPVKKLGIVAAKAAAVAHLGTEQPAPAKRGRPKKVSSEPQQDTAQPEASRTY